MKRKTPDVLVLLALFFGLGVAVTTYSHDMLRSNINYSYQPN